MTMYATLQMDREIDPNHHYISIGGFELHFKNGMNIISVAIVAVLFYLQYNYGGN